MDKEQQTSPRWNDYTSSDTPLHILVVDDEAGFVDVVSRELSEHAGYKTSAASSGYEAVTLLESGGEHYDVLLLDYDMKDMDGLAVLRWMVERKIEIPVIMLTGAGSEAVAVDAMKLGAYDYIRKEQMELAHLAVVIQATHERRMFRIARAIEEERLLETGLTDEATKQMRDVVGAIAHTIHSSFSSIQSEMQRGETQAQSLLQEYREPVQEMLRELQQHVGLLESSLVGFLKLYRLVYAHHAGRDEIQLIQREFLEHVETSGTKAAQ